MSRLFHFFLGAEPGECQDFERIAASGEGAEKNASSCIEFTLPLQLI